MQEGMLTQNIIIKEPSKNLRALGRNALSGKWATAIIAVCVYLLVLTLPPLIMDSLLGTNVGNLLANNGNTYGLDVDIYSQIYNSMPQFCWLSSIYMLLVTGAMTLGITLFFLASFRKHDVATVDIFLGFERFWKAFGLAIFQGFFVFLWSLLLIVPGIIASIRYSQAFFVLADDPSKSIRQCMDESKAMMKGNKSKYFWLTLSFIGWMILSSLPAGILESIGTMVSSNAFVVGIFGVVGGLFMAPVTAYMYSTLSGFYEILAGHLIKETHPVPVTPEEAVALEKAIAAPEEPAEEKTEEAANEPEQEEPVPESEVAEEKEKTDEQ